MNKFEPPLWPLWEALRPMTLQTEEASPWSVGDTCWHDKFGTGAVQGLRADGAVTVLFQSGETRKIIASRLCATTEEWTPPASDKKSKAHEIPKPANDNRKITDPIDGETLLGTDFPPVDWIVPGYITEGLTILAGRPKLGKSWLALGIGIAVATAGNVLGQDVDQGDAIYLALEDNRRRLKDRLEVVLPPRDRPNMSRLTLQTLAPSVDKGLVAMLDDWRAHSAEPKLVIIDTLAKVRPAKKSNQDSYTADYAAIGPIQEWSLQHRIAVIVVHHVRKMEAEDPLESVSGTNGLTGAADTIMVLDRRTDGPKIYGRGRDIEDFEKALKFKEGVWEVLGDADDVKRSEQRRAIIQTLTDATGIMTPTEIAKEVGLKVDNVKQLLPKLITEGKVEKNGYGQYKLAGR